MEKNKELVYCRICEGVVQYIFTKMVLNKYNVKYFICPNCNFLQTESPYWIKEAYSSGAISALDTGILYRNTHLRHKTQSILQKLFINFDNFIALDYGGGEGIFVRMMRDLGFNFYRYDPYADNLYAQFFDLKDSPDGIRFDVLTAFEVFEHLAHPIQEIKNMLKFSDTLIFSTELKPSVEKKELENWWYLIPETGQHIAFYDESALEEIADILGLNFYTDHSSLHVFSKFPINHPFTTNNKNINYIKQIFNILYHTFNKRESHPLAKLPTSLTLKDFDLVQKNLKTKEKKIEK